MAPQTVHLPNGQSLTVTPSFGGLYFRNNDLNTHQSVFPPGWTIILHSEDSEDDHKQRTADPDATPRAEKPSVDNNDNDDYEDDDDDDYLPTQRKRHIHRFKKPTLRNDHLFISSISNPSSNDFRPATSPTRQIAMMLWATLWWYFHQPEPEPQLTNSASAQTANAGKPKGEWRININREGIFQGKHLLPKLERMGLVTSEDSSVGLDPDDDVHKAGDSYSSMFVSRRAFWQLDARIYLFTVAPVTSSNSPFPSVSPAGSRSASPIRNSMNDASSLQASHFRLTGASTPPGPFHSASHLPTFYPPAPLQYTFTNNIRHPIRQKPPRQGETFYTRYIPSLGEYLSFRVASLSQRPITHRGPVSNPETAAAASSNRDSTLRQHHPTPSETSLSDLSTTPTTLLSDAQLLQKWMNSPRVAHSWGEAGPLSHQQAFLHHCLASKHSFPVIGCFDGKPFGFFEIYWVKEDRLAAHLGGECGDWDRGLHVLVGEEEFRGPKRVRVWLSALVHSCLLADMRTGVVMLEPRVDNVKLRGYLEEVGFYKEREVTFPHKQSNLMKIRREAFESPAL